MNKKRVYINLFLIMILISLFGIKKVNADFADCSTLTEESCNDAPYCKFEDGSCNKSSIDCSKVPEVTCDLFPSCKIDGGSCVNTGGEPDCSKAVTSDVCNLYKPECFFFEAIGDIGICANTSDPRFSALRESDPVDIDTSSGTCKSNLGILYKDLKSAFNVMKIIGPLLVIIYSSYDYILATVSKDADGLKKANSKLITRFILVAILFFLPIILNVLLSIIDPAYTACVS